MSETEDGVYCARCGTYAAWYECDNCGGIGLSGHDCGEDCCVCADPEPNVPCEYCRGYGGRWECMNESDWCVAHPLPGKEGVKRGMVVMVAERDW